MDDRPLIVGYPWSAVHGPPCKTKIPDAWSGMDEAEYAFLLSFIR